MAHHLGALATLIGQRRVGIEPGGARLTKRLLHALLGRVALPVMYQRFAIDAVLRCQFGQHTRIIERQAMHIIRFWQGVGKGIGMLRSQLLRDIHSATGRLGVADVGAFFQQAAVKCVTRAYPGSAPHLLKPADQVLAALANWRDPFAHNQATHNQRDW